MANSLNATVSQLTLNPDVMMSHHDATVEEILAFLQANDVGCVVLTDDDNKLSGVFTERDFLIKIVGRDPNLMNEPISNHMTSNPVCVTETDTVKEAMRRMIEGGFRHLIVVTSDGSIKNVISIRDLLVHAYQ